MILIDKPVRKTGGLGNSSVASNMYKVLGLIPSTVGRKGGRKNDYEGRIEFLDGSINLRVYNKKNEV